MKIIDISSLITWENNWKQLDKALFVYPTDSIYGLGTVATAENVAKIDAIKWRQPNKHYSIIAPSFSRLYEHFDVQKNTEIQRQWRYAEHWPLTVLCRRRDQSFLSRVSSNEYVGIRIINHPFQEFVTMLGQPFLSTSANTSWYPYDPLTLQETFSWVVDYYVTNDAVMTQNPSTLIQYDSWEVIRRN